MAKMELTYEQTDILFSELRPGDEWEGFTLVEHGEWVDQGKYQYQDIVFEKDGKFWRFTVDRNGSYFSDYYYGFAEGQYGEVATEVEKVEIVQTIWKDVKDE